MDVDRTKTQIDHRIDVDNQSKLQEKSFFLIIYQNYLNFRLKFEASFQVDHEGMENIVVLNRNR
jgi:hypothetical protein